ncbi:phosphoribosylamine--glycine ligase [Pseudactinotalea suaedae]|uniref:phosphoribosylamine--glycine ligase n=1 Tax=Pseudactinotalea suaedae TaxID=1524924 RepID=UPI0012E21DCD|nr:phosphoribosylamine--glycine ligase [Pseudactinotalea suaedae]
MKILVIGSGAREHALARALALDPATSAVVVAPGNPGTARLDSTENTPVDAEDPDAVAALAQRIGADLVVVGPEAPLVAGVADAVRAVGIPVFGPDAAAARIEGSKAFAKEIMAAAAVPTAMAHVCTTLIEVEAAMDSFGAPYVIKDDGLAAGKGVVVTEHRTAALAHAQACLDHASVVVEEYLDGPEVSLFCLADGRTVVPLAPAQDFKRLLDGDDGPNTGGMGAYSPLDWAPEGLTEQVVERVALPAVRELANRGTPFVGLLYCGLALTSRGLRVIEFNARFGDPETQVVLARLQSSLATALHAAATGSLHELPPLRWSEDAAVTVVLASHGYPASARRGDVISGLEAAEAIPDVHVLHAGTATNEAGELVTAGGRVLSVTATGTDIPAARAAAYAGVDAIAIPGGQHRTDIAAGL